MLTNFYYRLLIIALIMSLTKIYTGLLSPAIPALALNLGVSITNIQQLISIRMATTALVKFLFVLIPSSLCTLWLLIGLGLFSLTSLLSALCSDYQSLLISQIGSGAGLGTMMFVLMIMRDWFSGQQLRQFNSNVSILISIIHPLCPLIGGLLLTHFSWESLFVAMTLFAGICVFGLISTIDFQKSHIPSQPLQRLRSISSIIRYLRDNPTLGLVSIQLMMTRGGALIWPLCLPVFLIDQLSWSPEKFGLAFTSITMIVQIVGAFSNRFAITNFSETGIIRSCHGMIIAGILPLVFLSYGPTFANSLLITMGIYYFFTTFLWSNYSTLVFGNYPKDPSLTSSIYGLSDTLAGVIAALVSATLYYQNTFSFAAAIIAMHSLAYYCNHRIEQRQPR
tara:strand:- start:342 stop:1523 length:1182 start_codon:yes stop_codon:yes gene_type:complete